MTEWKAVPLDEIRVGDEVRVNGIGENVVSGIAIDCYGGVWWRVQDLPGNHATLIADCLAGFRRGSIVEARRKVEESVGRWRHGGPCVNAGEVMRESQFPMGVREDCIRSVFKTKEALEKHFKRMVTEMKAKLDPPKDAPPAEPEIRNPLLRSTGWSPDERKGRDRRVR